MSEFDIELSNDATTSFENNTTSKVGSRTYNETAAARTQGVGTSVGDSADEVDPRKLMDDPTINQLRWLYRTSLGKTLVDKPVEDAFKNGFEIHHDGERNIRSILNEFNYVNHYKRVRKKSRRDGFALTFLYLMTIVLVCGKTR